MSYRISSNSFSDPFLKPLLETLSLYFVSKGIKFYVIGASARDIICDLQDIKSGRATRDLDITIAISDWEQFAKIETDLLKNNDFTKDTQQKQRFRFKNVYPVDIVPYGDIVKQDDKIFWPPDESFAMSVLGFTEVETHTHEVVIDEEFSIRIASLAGIFILKLVAWIDRNDKTSRDADDIGFIIWNYFDINDSRIYSNYLDFYDDPEFTKISAGAKLLGKDIEQILHESKFTKQKVRSIIDKELILQEESRMVNQILETNRNFKYEELLLCLKNIVNELNI